MVDPEGPLDRTIMDADNWQQTGAGVKDVQRAKLLAMNSMDLAEILVRLDHM